MDAEPLTAVVAREFPPGCEPLEPSGLAEFPALRDTTDDGEVTMSGDLRGFRPVTARTEQGVKVDRTAIGPGVQFGSGWERFEGLQDPHHRLRRLEPAGINFNSGAVVHVASMPLG